MTDQPQDVPLEEAPPPEEPQDFRGVPDIPEVVEVEQKNEDGDSGDIDDILDLYGQICTQMETASTTLKGIFPLIDRLMGQISSGPDRRLDRRLRITTIVRTVGVAHSHLSRMARSARVASQIQRNTIDEAVDSPFE